MPIIPGSPEWHARIDSMLAEEAKQPLRWWYLSFATEEGFRGAAIVLAPGPTHALRRTHELGINPGGDVATGEIGPELPPVAHGKTDRLLTREDLEAMDNAPASTGAAPRLV